MQLLEKIHQRALTDNTEINHISFKNLHYWVKGSDFLILRIWPDIKLNILSLPNNDLSRSLCYFLFVR